MSLILKHFTLFFLYQVLGIQCVFCTLLATPALSQQLPVYFMSLILKTTLKGSKLRLGGMREHSQVTQRCQWQPGVVANAVSPRCPSSTWCYRDAKAQPPYLDLEPELSHSLGLSCSHVGVTFFLCPVLPSWLPQGISPPRLLGHPLLCLMETQPKTPGRGLHGLCSETSPSLWGEPLQCAALSLPTRLGNEQSGCFSCGSSVAQEGMAPCLTVVFRS